MHIFKRQPGSSGMVSIMVCMIMMVIISLIVLGFAQISRRERAEALDRQLSAQAFYAAESGINDVRALIKSLPGGSEIPEKNQCGPTAEYPTTVANPLLDGGADVKYTCLLVSTRLKNITGAISGLGSSQMHNFQPSGASDQMRIKWNATTLNFNDTDIANRCRASVPASSNFPAAAKWNCPYGVLRMDIVPTDVMDRSAMANGQKTFFFYPTSVSGTATQPLGVQSGTVAPMRCSAAAGCAVNITGMNTASKYAVRITAIYAGGTYDVSAYNSANVQLELTGGQVQIDSTGKARDVLRRVQVRLPYAQPAMGQAFAIQSGSSLCKRFELTSTYFGNPAFAKPQDTKNPMCRPIAPCLRPTTDIVLVLDTSESMGKGWPTDLSPITRMDRLLQVTTFFVNNSKVALDSNHEAIVWFNGNRDGGPGSGFLTSLTGDTAVLSGAVQALPGTQDFGTMMSWGLDRANEELFDKVPPGRPTSRKVVVFVSDGEPVSTIGQKAFEEGDRTLDRARALEGRGAEIFSVGILAKDYSRNWIYDVASNPGNYFDANTDQELQDALAKIAAEVGTCK